MCGRYALALRPSQVRQMLQEDDMPVYDAPADDGPDAPRQSYNFAPGYHGIVYRADVPDTGAAREVRSVRKKVQREKVAEKAANRNHMSGATAAPGDQEDARPAEGEQTHDHTSSRAEEPHYILQSMKWGLVPFWTKRNPDYASMLKTINCRDDSLATPGGMWNTMKARKRCIVVAQGFFEWLKPGGPGTKEKIPHFVRRKDGKLMCFAGLWDCVTYGDQDVISGNPHASAQQEAGVPSLNTLGGSQGGVEKHYTYTVITTDSNAQLKFLHDRMPVILEPGSDKMRMWLDPRRSEWSRELQEILKPYDGELEVYPVSREVGKVGNNSPSFVIPVGSKDNKNNIANFFEKGKEKGGKVKPQVEVNREGDDGVTAKTEPLDVFLAEEEPADEKPTSSIGSERLAPPPSPVEEPPTKKGSFSAISPSRGRMSARKTERPDDFLAKEDPAGEDNPPIKRSAPSSPPTEESPPAKKGSFTATATATPSSPPFKGRGPMSARKNIPIKNHSPAKAKRKGGTKGGGGSQKITKFFGNSA